MTPEQIEFLKGLHEEMQAAATSAKEHADELQKDADMIKSIIETEGSRAIAN